MAMGVRTKTMFSWKDSDLKMKKGKRNYDKITFRLFIAIQKGYSGICINLKSLFICL